ncbi:uncharacterized protein LOC143851407 isoform X2 [Tasmannia lanceolata]
MPPGADLSQLTLRPEFAKSQLRTQQASFNGFMQSPHGFQTRSNQVEFMVEDTVPYQHNLTLRGLAVIESQQGNAPEHSLGLTRISEELQTAESPVNFDFLGGQQMLVRNQQSGVPQPRLGQQSGFNDMPLWQQHFMYKQLDTKQTGGDQLPALVNEAPIYDSSNYMWPGDLMGGDSKIPSTSQMFMAGNTNWVQWGGSPAMQGYPNGLMLSQDQSQALRSMGFVDQSLYGSPVASTGGSLNQYSQFQGIPRDGAGMLTKTGRNQGEKPVTQSAALNSFQIDQSALFSDQACIQDAFSVSEQGFQGKNLFGHVPVQTLNSVVLPGNFQQFNPLPRDMPTQEFHARLEKQADWAGILQEKTATQMGPFHGMISLDPTEEKILFNDDGVWDSSFGSNSGMGTMSSLDGNQLENTDYLNVFPSVQSGSWSALMQSAVAEASSSDTGLQDEWSGLSFQKMEVSTRVHPTVGDEKHTTWLDNNLQTASSSSRPFPLFDDTNVCPSSRSIPVFQQSSTKYSLEQGERERTNPSHVDLQQSPKEPGKWLDQSSQQKPLLEGSLQVQTPVRLENDWGNQMYEQSRSSGHSDVELNLQSMQGSWDHQQRMPSYNISNKLNGWNMNESLSPSGAGGSKICDNENNIQHAQSNEHKRAIHIDRDHDGITGMWKATDNRVSVSFPSSIGGIKRVKSGSPQLHSEDSYMSNFTALPNSRNSKISQEINQHVLNSHQLEYGKHANLDSSVKYRGNENVERNQYQLGKGQVQESSMNNSDIVSGEIFDKERDNSFQKQISNDSGNQKSVGRKSSGALRFQYHPMGNLAVNVDASDTTKHTMHLQGLSQPVTRGPKSQDQGYYCQPKFVCHAVSNNVMDMEKGCLPDSKRNGKGAEDAPSRGIHLGYDSTVSSSFDGSAAFYAPKVTGQTSQNMLELLHKVDQSREKNIVAQIVSSDQTLSEIPEGENLHHSYSSASQGFGLRLAPPSQRMSISNHALSSRTTSQTINDLNSRHVDPQVRDNKGQTWLTTPSVQHLPPVCEVSQREYWDNKSSISGLTGDENSPSNMQENSSATVTSGLPFNLSPHAESRVGIASTRSYSSEPGRSQPMNVTSSYPRVSGQQHSVMEPVPVSQPPITSGMSQHGAFSTMLHNVWTNVSIQQRLSGGPPHKVPPNVFQSMCPSNSTLETTSWATHRADDHGMKNGVNVPSECGTCTINSQHFTYGEEQPGKDNSVQQISSGRFDLAPQTDVAPQRKDPVARHLSDIEAFGRSLKPSDVLRQNYSLLNQMQVMKDAEIDPNRKTVKRLKGAESQAMATFGQNDSQKHSSHHSIASTPSSPRGNDHAKINPQMASSWFEKYGSYTNGEILAIYDGLDSSRRTAKVAAQQFSFGKDSENLHTHSTVEQANAGDASQVGSAWQIPTITVVASEYISSSQSLPPDAVDQNLAVVRPKKRKSVASKLLPWHKEVTQGSDRLQNISMAEMDWAQATNRWTEKVECESEVIDDGPPIPRSQRRLILTTQLMQQLFCSIPATILSAEATSEYEIVAYFTAKLALRDACSRLISCSGSESCVHPNNRNTTSEKRTASERVGNHFFSEVVEDFISRARKLESDLSRLDKRSSILDIRVECQDLERYSIINRFATIHVRGTTDGVESSSSSEATARKTVPQRYVTVLPMPRNFPEGVLCLSL